MAYTGRELIAARCAKFFKDGDFVNLGIGVPTMCINYLPEGVDLWLETETGACGTGPTPPIDKWDTDFADAGSNPITLLPQGSWLPHDRSFGFIPGKLAPGMGGAMDLCSGGIKKVVVATDHCEKSGSSKILKKCTLPLTGYHCVTDIVTERCYFKVTPDGLVLMELAPGYTVEDIRACTDADFTVNDVVGVME